MQEKINGELHLVLGCFGLKNDGFVSCSCCKNSILKISPNIENYDGLMDYLDVCRLFDKPIFDYNAIRNILQNINSRFNQSLKKRLWKEDQLQRFEKFLKGHNLCGLYLQLVLIENANEIKQEVEEVEVPIKAIPKIVSAPNHLKVIK